METNDALVIQEDFTRAQRGKGFVRAQAGFHADLLPTWGGNAKDILEQPKCWSSRAVTQEVRQSVRAQKLAIRTGRRSQKGEDSSRLMRLHHHKKSFQGSNPSSNQSPTSSEAGDIIEANEDRNGRGGAVSNGGLGQKNHTGKLGAPSPHGGASSAGGAGLISPIDILGNDVRNAEGTRTQDILQKIEERCEELREDPEAFRELLLKIIRVRKEHQKPLPYGRKLVIENKWLCDDKETCMGYWREIHGLKRQITETEAKQDKLRLLALWPTPPEENQSRQKRENKILERGAETNVRIVETQLRRKQLDEERQEELRYLINRREMATEFKRKLERSMQLRAALCKLVIVAKAGKEISLCLEAVQAQNQERRRKLVAAAIIQRRWKSTKAAETGAQYRNAVRVIRRFAVQAVELRRKRKLRDAVNIIHWFLTAYENANFQMVMRNYRYRVVNCQRYFRSYVEITKQRSRALKILWDKIEREKIKTERTRAIAVMRKTRLKEPSSKTIRSSQEPMNPGTTGNQRSRGDLHNNNVQPNQGRKRNQALRQIRVNGSDRSMLSMHPGLYEQVSTRSTLVSGGNSTSLIAAADLGINVHRKVPKDIRRKLLKEYLETTRTGLKEQWKRYCRSRNTTAAEARLVTVEDVRSAVHAKHNMDLASVFTKRGEAQAEKQVPPFMKLYTYAVEGDMLALIEKGRAMADEQFLNVLNEEDPSSS